MEQVKSCPTLYGVGVGPGDPELLTVKAVRIIQSAHVIVVPDSGAGRQAALDIVRPYLTHQRIVQISTPMVREKALLDEAHQRCADQICSLLDQGNQVVYLTLGDPTIYSTYLYVHRRVVARGYPAEMVPGIPSFCAAAAKLGISLCEGEEPLLILPTAKEGEPSRVNRVYMKQGRSILALQAQLREEGALDHASLVVNCGMEDEALLPHFEDLKEPSGYFSLVIVKNPGE